MDAKKWSIPLVWISAYIIKLSDYFDMRATKSSNCAIHFAERSKLYCRAAEKYKRRVAPQDGSEINRGQHTKKHLTPSMH